MWSHRERLLKVARRRSLSVEDAEDAVHEAMIRAAERSHVEDDRLGAWLTTVTIRLCIDRFRQVGREAEVHTRSVRATPRPATVEEAVCDRAEAQWLAARSTDLPRRQEEVLALLAQGMDVAQIAQRTGLTYQAVRSLLARARRALRATLAGTLAVAVWLWRGRPRVAGAGTQSATLVSAAVTVAIAGLGLTAPSPAEADEAPAPRLRPYVRPLPADPLGAAQKGWSPAPYEPLLSDLPAGAGLDRVRPMDQGVDVPRAEASPALPSPPSAAPSDPPGAGLPAVPALPGTPDPALPAVPDATAVVAPEVPGAPTAPAAPTALPAPVQPVQSVQPVEPASAVPAFP
ncbi:sigma-70 family RNA polymerase sigma factor [Streptomyces himalayensis]|uniref:sigma-70 family RNA polymerase sigma factor n=1 Tax=Streptomyces himalayensis TaxID=2820085 RepID=UPI0028B1F740|nr:sigma-70 family RNA polymerase sigma factor [Streptomyces himalayensis]